MLWSKLKFETTFLIMTTTSTCRGFRVHDNFHHCDVCDQDVKIQVKFFYKFIQQFVQGYKLSCFVHFNFLQIYNVY